MQKGVGQRKTSEHVPCGFLIVAVRSDGKKMGPFLYRREGCVEKFVETLKEVEQVIREDLENKCADGNGKRRLHKVQERRDVSHM